MLSHSPPSTEIRSGSTIAIGTAPMQDGLPITALAGGAAAAASSATKQAAWTKRRNPANMRWLSAPGGPGCRRSPPAHSIAGGGDHADATRDAGTPAVAFERVVAVGHRRGARRGSGDRQHAGCDPRRHGAAVA